MVTLGADALSSFPRFTRYNSPYVAHREGRAIDLYPGTEMAPSPVAGEVRDTKTMACPTRPYAEPNDHLIVIDTGEHLARLLHVEPTVEPGDQVAVGDELGRLVRSGYFAPWVDNHVHLGFRAYGADPVRASGSLRIEVETEIDAVPWDGTGTVLETGASYAILDTPAHPAPAERYVGIADDTGRFLLDGGIPHYPNGGIVPVPSRSTVESPGRLPDPTAGNGSVELLGTTLGHATGQELPWESVRVLANGTEIMGLSFFLGRDAIFAKLICPDTAFSEGEAVSVRLERTD